ncbi:MAG: NAD+ synthase [Candidatus Poseidoniaceae archaeon]|jgi:NAD+ synthetase|nr:NAD+ synthase [Candidatus Poseidoniaceae archaeon]
MARRVALLQSCPIVGDIGGNAEMILQMTKIAKKQGASLAVSTELIISGYPPRDLLLQDDFVVACNDKSLSLDCEIPVLIGSPVPPLDERSLPGNGVIRAGESPREVTRKQLLPTYDVFDEARYFEADERPGIARTIGGLNLGVTICEDAWQHCGATPNDYDSDPISQIVEWGRQGVSLDATVNLSASPYHSDKVNIRLQVARSAAKSLGHPFLLANQVGGNDDLLFDGRSIVAWPNGQAILAPGWSEGVLIVDLDEINSCTWIGEGELQILDVNQESEVPDDDLLDAIVIGLADYCKKSGISSIVLGLSGGIDSALAACVAASAVGAENVTGISMPSRHSSQHSIDDARSTAHNLGINFEIIPIEELHKTAETSLDEILSVGHPVAAENLQARLRGMIVMAFANANGAMAIATGNKSELGQGYCTLYGDMAGGYAPLGDLYKMEVYALAKAFNNRFGKDVVNNSTLTKPPSAELAPDQKDEDSLPPYPILDDILRLHIEEGLDATGITNRGYDLVTVNEVLTRLASNEHKRWQMPPAPRVSKRAFGQGWRQPLAARHDWRNFLSE